MSIKEILKENSTYYTNGIWVNPDPYLIGEKDIRATTGNMRAAETVKTADTTIRVGDKVKVLNAVTYDGKLFRVFHDKYEVLQVNGDRVVIGVGGVTTAAVRARDVREV